MPVPSAPDESNNTRPVIGLIGGIGAGKSHVASILQEEGCFIVESDAIAHEALEDPHVREAILLHFGTNVLAADGRFDRAKLAERIFTDAGLRATLEGIVHPWIERERRARTAGASSSSRAIVIDAPLLLEVGLDRECDHVLFIDAPEDIRRARLMGHRGWSAAQCSVREAAQLPLSQKRARATAVIENAGDGETADRLLRAAIHAFLVSIERA
ncbi:MAG: dephospho-CoA kinase [Planctomycetota bacterium]|nr:MAG: dephospho-CoA kinase [Planctomycetota bacterium]